MADMKIGHPDPTRVDSISRKKPGNTHLRRIPSWYQDCDALSPAVHDVQTTDSPRDPSAFARPAPAGASAPRYTPSVTKRILRSEEHTSELQSPCNLVCRLLLEKKKKKNTLLPTQ